MRNILAKIQTTPGVESAAAANTHILTGGSSSNSMTIQSDRRFVTDRAVSTLRVGLGFFRTMGLHLLAGRRDRNPAGYRVGFGNQPDVVTNTEIIGVVEGLHASQPARRQ